MVRRKHKASCFNCVARSVAPYLSGCLYWMCTEKLIHLHNGMRQITGSPLSINTSSVLYSKFIRYAF